MKRNKRRTATTPKRSRVAATTPKRRRPTANPPQGGNANTSTRKPPQGGNAKGRRVGVVSPTFSIAKFKAGTKLRDTAGNIYTVKACIDLSWISGGEWKGYHVVME